MPPQNTDIRARIFVPEANSTFTLDSKGTAFEAIDADSFPCKEFSITDDVLNVADSACVTISNIDGENSGKFLCGMLIIFELSDPTVASGKWVRMFTGRITGINYHGGLGGENITIAAMDLGWHLTSCHAQVLVGGTGKNRNNHRSIRGATFKKLLEMVIDPTWKSARPGGPEVFFSVVTSNDTNVRLKHGRQVATQEYNATAQVPILPPIQIEPGQAPWDIIQLYAAREGWLINIGARGELIIFQPHYDSAPLYVAEYHSSTDASHNRNTIIGSPSLTESIEGLFSQVQCWSTVLLPPPPGTHDADNPNAQYTHSEYRPDINPLPFNRWKVLTDSEAINPTLRKSRSIWTQRMGLFNSWTYEVEFEGLSQNGAFFVSDTMISVHDSVHGVDAVYYVQSVQKSVTLQGGTKTRVTIKQPNLLNPKLTFNATGGGTKKAAKHTNLAGIGGSGFDFTKVGQGK